MENASIHQSDSQHRNLVCEALYNLGFRLTISSALHFKTRGRQGGDGALRRQGEEAVLRYSEAPTPEVTATTADKFKAELSLQWPTRGLMPLLRAI
jgi:hypothetical protein